MLRRNLFDWVNLLLLCDLHVYPPYVAETSVISSKIDWSCDNHRVIVITIIFVVALNQNLEMQGCCNILEVAVVIQLEPYFIDPIYTHNVAIILCPT